MIRNDDLPYPIVVSTNIRPPLRQFLREARRFVVLCDANVAKRAHALTAGIKGRLGVLPFALGERRKTLGTLEHIFDALAEAGAERTTTVVGVGGGVASDLFGLAAALYVRGVPYAHVATTLVAMVDAAIGGKTGVNLRAGKNLAGTFVDPRAVFCDVEALQTLPYRHLREGLAEMVKHGVIEGGDVFEALETLAPHAFWRWPWETVIADSLKVKTMIVNDDRLEAGARELLNLGHTFAHAFERAGRYRVSHGAGVAVGLRAAGLLALRLGRWSEAEHFRMLALLALLRLPLLVEEDPAAVLAAMRVDKKKRDGELRFVVPRSLGDVETGVRASDRTVMRVLERCVTVPDESEFW